MYATPVAVQSRRAARCHPHLLGFEPARAIVVMALRGNRLGLTQRMDLPDPDRVEAVAEEATEIGRSDHGNSTPTLRRQ